MNSITSTKPTLTKLMIGGGLAMALLAGCVGNGAAGAVKEERLVAEGEYGDWSLEVTWTPGTLSRHVKWRQRDWGEGDFVVPLRTRRRPYTYTSSWKGMELTRYGPYQPAFVLHRDGVRYFMTMGHERADFPTVEMLTDFLSSYFYNDPSQVAVSPDGTLVVLLVSGVRDKEVCAGMTVYYLTVAGVPPTRAVLEPFLKGSIRKSIVDPQAEKDALQFWGVE